MTDPWPFVEGSARPWGDGQVAVVSNGTGQEGEAGENEADRHDPHGGVTGRGWRRGRLRAGRPAGWCRSSGVHGDLSLIHISEPTRLGMISYAVFCLKK